MDILKDRLYTSAAKGLPRRSAQTALYYLCEGMVRWLAPIVSFTADEIWRYMPGKRNQSVFLNAWFTQFPQVETEDDAFWQWLIQLRNEVNKVLESYRADGKIGSALEADVTLHCSDAAYEKLQSIGDELRFVLITSAVNVVHNRDVADVEIQVCVVDYPKCERCWHRCEDIGKNKTYETLCGRCIENISGEGEVRHFA